MCAPATPGTCDAQIIKRETRTGSQPLGIARRLSAIPFQPFDAPTEPSDRLAVRADAVGQRLESLLHTLGDDVEVPAGLTFREIHVLARFGALRVDLRLQSLEALIHLLEALIHLLKALIHLLKALIHLPEALIHLLKALIHLLKALIHLPEALIHLLEALIHLPEALIHLIEAVAHVARQPVDRLLQISDVIGRHSAGTQMFMNSPFLQTTQVIVFSS